MGALTEGEKGLVSDLRKLLAVAGKTFGEYCSSFKEGPFSDGWYTGHLEEATSSQIKGVYNHLCFTLERFGMNGHREQLVSEFSPHLGNLTCSSFDQYSCEINSPPLEVLHRMSAPVLSLMPVSASSDMQLLERMLRSTAYFVHQLKIIPGGELSLNKAMFSVFSVVFPETVPEPSIPHLFKTYRPDFGVTELSTAIEFKFVNSSVELKRAVDGVYSDIHAYTGSGTWKHYYSVYYMTDAFTTSDRMEAEYRLAEVPDRWKPILVNGQGGRTKAKGKS